MKPIHVFVFLCFFLLSLTSCGGDGGSGEEAEGSQVAAGPTPVPTPPPTVTSCGDVSVSVCNVPAEEEESEEETPSDESPEIDTPTFDLQGDALRTAPAVAAKIAELEAEGFTIERVYKRFAKDCSPTIVFCGGSVSEDNDTTITVNQTSIGDNSNVE